MPFKYTVRHVPSGQNIADCLSRLTKIPASPRDVVTEEYVRMVAVNATPRAMTTRERERESAEDEEMTEVRRFWKTGNWSAGKSIQVVGNYCGWKIGDERYAYCHSCEFA